MKKTSNTIFLSCGDPRHYHIPLIWESPSRPGDLGLWSLQEPQPGAAPIQPLLPQGDQLTICVLAQPQPGMKGQVAPQSAGTHPSPLRVSAGTVCLSTGPYFCQGLGLQGLVVPQAAVPGGAARRPHGVPFRERLLVRVVDAASTSERCHPPLLGALDPAPGEGDFVGAAGAGGGPGWRVYAGSQAPGRAVCVTPTSAPGDGRSARS